MNALRFCLLLTLSAFASPVAALEISSPAVGDDRIIPDKFTANAFGCNGQNISLPLTWKGVPKEAKSLTVTMYDPDAPTGSGFWHWEVANLPVSTTELPEGAGEEGNAKLPKGAVQARNDAGTAAYFGPCPPKGDKRHRYIFTIFAVKSDRLDINENSSGAVVGFNLHFNTLEKASVTYLYGR